MCATSSRPVLRISLTKRYRNILVNQKTGELLSKFGRTYSLTEPNVTHIVELMQNIDGVCAKRALLADLSSF